MPRFVSRVLSAALLILMSTALAAANENDGLAAHVESAAGVAMSSGLTPGFSIAILRAGKIVYAKGFGLADVAANTPARATTRYAAGSITKQFTAAGILLLVQAGKLHLDDKLSLYEPQMPNAGRLTVRQLLNQVSGLHNYPYPAQQHFDFTSPISTSAILDVLKDDKPDFAPGAQWAYSNTNYATLAGVIEKVSGQSYSHFIESRILGPLKMRESGIGYAAQHRGAIAKPYRGSTPFLEQDPASLDIYSGAGALVSTVLDLAKWDGALLHGTVLSEASRAAMFAKGARSDGTPVKYGFGFVPDAIGTHREIWHNGLAPGAGGYCLNAIFPDDDLAVVILSNGFNFEGQPEKLVRSVLSFYDRNAPRQEQTPFPAVSGEDIAVTARAKEWLGRGQTGNIDRAQLTLEMNAALTSDVQMQTQMAWGSLGKPLGFRYAGKRVAGRVTLYVYRVEFATEVRRFLFALDDQGKVAGLRLPPWEQGAIR